MKIHFDKLYKDDRVDELLGISIPFKKGELLGDALDRLSIYDGDTRLPVQSKITSTWEDGSVRFAYVRFLGTLPGNKGKDFEVRILESSDNSQATLNDTGKDIELKSDEGAICLSNGCVSFSIGGSKEQLFDSFTYGDKDLSGDFFEGPYFKFAGKELSPVFDSCEVVEEGPLFTILERKGHYEISSLEPSGEGIKFELRLMVAASKPWVEVSFRLFNCTDKTIEPDLVRAFIRGFDSEKSDIKATCGISNYKTRFTESETGEKVELLITAEMLEKEANEHFGEAFYGTFLGDVTDKTRNYGICATVFQAQQNFPKAISASRDGIEIGLLPDKEETMKLSKAQPVRFESGMAREQRFLLHFHDGDEDRYELNNRSIIYQMPDTGYLDPKVFEEAGVFPDIFLDEDKQIDDVEISLIDKADAHARCYGMLCWGDGPDPGYTSQGRGGGDLVWTNNEYDYPPCHVHDVRKDRHQEIS